MWDEEKENASFGEDKDFEPSDGLDEFSDFEEEPLDDDDEEEDDEDEFDDEDEDDV